MNKIIQNIKLAVIDRFTTDTAELIGKFRKLEARIEASIAKDTRKLMQLRQIELSVAAARKAKDASVNAAYKMLHNVSELTR